MKISINNQLLIEPYVDAGLKSEISGGLARPVQRNRLVGLRVLADARVTTPGSQYPLDVPAGSLAYISEEKLVSAQTVWARAKMKSSLLEGEFIVVDAAHVVAFDLLYPDTEAEDAEERAAYEAIAAESIRDVE